MGQGGVSRGLRTTTVLLGHEKSSCCTELELPLQGSAQNCISEDRLNVLELYEYRKKFLTTCANDGGKRDAARKEMAQHADAAGNLSRSFVVGPLNDCCVASAGLAKGISFGSWASARADLRKKRPLKVGRTQVRVRAESIQRRTLEAYIRSLREGMEGAKGRDAPYNWSTGKRTVPKR